MGCISIAVACAACGGGPQPPGRPQPAGGLPLSGPLESYHDLGFVTGPAHFPAIAAFSVLAGPADSCYVLFGMSVPNSALRFQRDPAGFVASYRVTMSFATPDSQVVQHVSRDESVRVPTFQETTRTDESILFQHILALVPGTYIVTLEANDANSARGFRSIDTVVVPDYARPGPVLAQPVVTYDGSGRAGRGDVPDLILNPRHTTSYGGDPPRLYLEVYHADSPTPVSISVHDELGDTVWGARTTITQGDSALRRAIVELPSASLPLGRLSVELSAADGSAVAEVPIVISISDQWLIASFEDVLQFVQYIATRAELDSLSSGSPADRREVWDAFWKRRDPLPATPENEFRNEFFQRVRSAAEQFSEAGGQAGWRTARGEVYIVLGPPSFVQERYIGRTEFIGRPNALEWLYESAPGGRLSLLFIDQNGFGHYELSPSSESAFRAIADRLKREPGG